MVWDEGVTTTGDVRAGLTVSAAPMLVAVSPWESEAVTE
jgi:hypothetical protein